ncbi:hypothetical protein [Marinifilum fragile]|uniref:hypothetical protein n=1 Tax=Marinifilum fragile TaxID=570161 RepID=UPI002AA6B356|nr:hypothetical protein [Marinifilum fragile]
MKLKFLSLGLLALSVIACDSYEETESVAAMRNARTEYVKAETALKTAQIAYQQAQTKSQEIANAYAEARNAAEIERLQVQLEQARIDLEEAKAVLESTIARQKQYVQDLEDGAINKAYAEYTDAYTDWSNETYNLLNEQNELANVNISLAGAKMDDENWVATQIANRNADIARYNSQLEEYSASLATYKALEESNDWDAVIVELETKRKELAELQAEENNLNADVDLANDKENDAENTLRQWANDNYIYSAIVRGKGILEMADDFNTRKTQLATDTIAPFNEMTTAKTNLDAAKPTDDGYNVLLETYNNKLNAYNEAIDAYEDYKEAVLKSELNALNSTYITACDKRDGLYEEYSEIYGKRSALNDEVNNLNSLSFTIETNVFYGAEWVENHLNDMISGTESNIRNIQYYMDEAEEMLANYEAGNYSRAETVRNYEQQVANIEFRIAQYTSQVETAKAWLDSCEAKYKALIEG